MSEPTIIVRGSGSVQAVKNALGGEAVRAAMRHDPLVEIPPHVYEWLDTYITAEWHKAGRVEVRP